MLEDTAGTASILRHATLSCLTYKKTEEGGKKGAKGTPKSFNGLREYSLQLEFFSPRSDELIYDNSMC